MDVSMCANCLLHGWKQVEDSSELQRCQACKLILYCGKDCQKEHWSKVHKKQCKYLKDPAMVEGKQHEKNDCAICKQVAQVGEARLTRADNPNYGCVYEGFQWPPCLHHPHPFPITGQPDDTYEKAIIVLLNLVKKVELTQPRVKRNCRKELEWEFALLIRNRCLIWRNRKIFPQSHTQRLVNDMDYNYLPDFFFVADKVMRTCKKREAMRSPFELWKVILLVNDFLLSAYFLKHLLSLKDPLLDLPADFELLVYDGLNNSDKFLARVNQILETLANQVISYQDILLIICGGSYEKTCSMCNKEIIISNHHKFHPEGGDIVLFDCLFVDVYFCNRESCRDKMKSMRESFDKFQMSVFTLFEERKKLRCDFCYQLPSNKDVHRCNVCLSTMYCSKTCQVEDWKVHQMVCKENVEERKKKTGGGDRKKEAKDALEKLEKKFNNMDILDKKDENCCEICLRQKRRAQNEEEACCGSFDSSEVISKFKLKNANKAKK